MQLTTSAAVDLIGLAGADRGAARRRASSSRRSAARPCRRPRSRTGLAKKSKMIVLGLPPSSVGEIAQMGDRLALAGLEQGIVEHRREIARDRPCGVAASRWPSSPSSLGVIAIWCGPRRPSTWIVADRAVAERAEGMGDDVRADELGRRLGRGCGRRRARHCRCRSPPPPRRRAADRDRRIRDGRYTSRRTPPSRSRPAGRRPGCSSGRSLGAPVARMTAS